MSSATRSWAAAVPEPLCTVQLNHVVSHTIREKLTTRKLLSCSIGAAFAFCLGKVPSSGFQKNFSTKPEKKISPQSQKRIFVLKVFLHKVRKKFCSQRLQSGPRSLFSLLLTYMVARFRTKKLAQCLLPILLIQEKPFANFTKCNHSETV